MECYTKGHGATLQFASAGTGSQPHLACALLNSAIGINITHVPYRGGAQAMQDLIAGRIAYQCVGTSVAIPHIQSGAAKAIAILSKGRSPALPELPSAHEQGLVDFDVGSWTALFAPKRTPPTIIAKLNTAVVATMD